MLGGPKEAPSRRIEVDSIYTSGDHLKGGGLLGGVSTLQETGLTGPISIYKLVPKVGTSEGQVSIVITDIPSLLSGTFSDSQLIHKQRCSVI